MVVLPLIGVTSDQGDDHLLRLLGVPVAHHIDRGERLVDAAELLGAPSRTSAAPMLSSRRCAATF
jgi:hypothetical protein